MSERCGVCGRIEWAETCWRGKVRAVEAERDEAVALLRRLQTLDLSQLSLTLQADSDEFIDRIDTKGTGDR